MPAIDQIWLFVGSAVVAGLIVGAILTRSLSGRHAYHSEVRWRRRYSEAAAEHDLRIATLTKTLDHARDKQNTLRQALNESDETIRLLSADGESPFEQEIAERNLTIEELRKTVSHARAMVADATDHETTLQNQVDSLRSELIDRDNQIKDLKNQNAEHASSQQDSDQQRYDVIQEQLTTVRHELASRDQQLNTLTEQLTETRLLLNTARSQLGEKDSRDKLEERLATVQRDLASRDQQLANLNSQLQAGQLLLDKARSDIAEKDTRINVLNEQVRDMRLLLPRLNKSIGEHETAMASVVAALSSQRKETLSLQQELKNHAPEAEPEQQSGSTAKIISLHKHVMTDDLVEPVHRVDPADEDRVRILEHELQEWKSKFEAVNNGTGLEGRFPSTDAVAPGETNSKDDLKRINGIGPVLESALNELGFYQFEQIAQMSQHEIEQMGRHDRTLPGRIRRYKWIEQAMKLSTQVDQPGA